MASNRGLATLACVLGLATPVLWFTSLVTPGEEAVKVRNALVAGVGDAGEFDWEPARAPATFKQNAAQPNAAFRASASAIGAEVPGQPQQGLELGVAISRHLMGAPQRKGGPIQAGLDESYRRITAQGQGYCADFTRVFSGLALAAGLPVRTWSISFEGFGAGHSFNEVYDASRAQWIMMDPFHSLYFVDAASGEPLSVLEVHRRLVLSGARADEPAVRRIVPARVPFANDALALDYYRRGFRQLALVWGNNVFDYDQSGAVRAAAHASRHVERAVAIGLDLYPDLMIYPEGRSQRDVEELFRTRDRFVLAAALTLLSFVVFGLLLFRLWRPGRRTRGARSVLQD
jgi:hypothetical protein